MEEKNIKKEPKQVQIKLKLKTLIIIAVIIVVLLASNVFAGVMGYGNIFFMIKNLVTTGTLEGKDEILSDREITISYSNINIAPGIELQVNKMIIEKEKSTLFLHVKNKPGTGLRYELYNESKKSIGETEVETIREPEFEESYDLDIISYDEITENDILELNVSSLDEKKLLRTIKIDLGKREITVEGEEEISKISESELKKYLSCFAMISSDKIKDLEESALYAAINLRGSILGETGIPENPIELYNEMIAEMYDGAIGYITKDGKDILDLEGVQYYYNSKEKSYNVVENSKLLSTTCVDVRDISYANGVYTVKFIYVAGEEGAKLEEMAQYETTLELKLNGDYKYSKYKIVGDYPSEEISEEKRVNVVENDKKDTTKKENNKSSVFDGADKLKYDSDLKSDKNGKIAVLKSGENTFRTIEKDGYFIYKDMFDIKYEIKEITQVNSVFEMMSNDNSAALYRCIITFIAKDGHEDKFDIAVVLDGEENISILGTYDNYTGTTRFVRTFTDLYSEPETQEDNKTDSTSAQNVDNYASSMKWTKYVAPGLKFEYPTEFNLEEIGGSNRGNMGGEVTTKITGLARGINPDTKEIIDSNLVISFYEPVALDKEEADKYLNWNSTAFITKNGLKWCEELIGNHEGELYTTVFTLSEGNCVAIRVKFESDKMENFKVTNIVNYLLGTTKTTSY